MAELIYVNPKGIASVGKIADNRSARHYPANWLTGKQVADMLGINLNEARELFKKGKIRAHPCKRGHVINPEDFKKFLAENTEYKISSRYPSLVASLYKQRPELPIQYSSKQAICATKLTLPPTLPMLKPRKPKDTILKPGTMPIVIPCKFVYIPLRPYHKAGTTIQGYRENDVLSAITSNNEAMKNFVNGVSVRTIRLWINTGRILADKTEIGPDGIPVLSKTGSIFFIEPESLRTFLYVKYNIPKTSIVSIDLNNKTH